MFDIFVCLAILTKDSKRGISVVVIEKDGSIGLPALELCENEQSSRLAEHLFYQLTGREAHPWLLITQSGFVDCGKKPMVLYGVTTPEQLGLVADSAKWMSMEEMMEREDCVQILTLLNRWSNNVS